MGHTRIQRHHAVRVFCIITSTKGTHFPTASILTVSQHHHVCFSCAEFKAHVPGSGVGKITSNVRVVIIYLVIMWDFQRVSAAWFVDFQRVNV
jgi:hypothetical protein